MFHTPKEYYSYFTAPDDIPQPNTEETANN
jgi:hypothetical protein